MVLIYIFGAIVLINCIYFLLFSKLFFFKFPEKIALQSYPVSLIVCAKNEAENLKKHIPLWLQQEYSHFELILINDASTDETLAVMESFAVDNPIIQIVNVKNNEAFWGNKKYALTLGIKRAKSERLIFTDADCYPASKMWLSRMVAHFSAEKKIILGYGAYEKRPGLLNKLIRFETLMTAIQYLSYANAGMPYMGVGRNLAYSSSLYYENNGYMGHINLASGDDDLFVNEAATTSNVSVCMDKDAFTYSIPKKSFQDWISQKKRHYTTASFYKLNHRFLLSLYFLSNILFWVLALISLFTDFWKISLPFIFIRVLFQYIIIGKAAKKLRELDLVAFFPFYEIFLILTQLSIFISKRENNSKWK